MQGFKKKFYWIWLKHFRIENSENVKLCIYLSLQFQLQLQHLKITFISAVHKELPSMLIEFSSKEKSS
jgi:hypothetical protein